MKLGDFIYSYRQKNKLSMDDFSKKSGISKTYISLLEKGNHPQSGKPIIPYVSTIKKAAKAMMMNPEELLSSIDQDISIADITEPDFIIDDEQFFELYKGYVRLPEVTKEKLLQYFEAIIEVETKENNDLSLREE